MRCHRIAPATLAAALLSSLFLCPTAGAQERAIGDTLTVVMRPILSVPAIVVAGNSFTIEALAPQSTTGWSASLTRAGRAPHSLGVVSASYLTSHERWFIGVTVPGDVPEDVYDLEVTASGGIYDEVAHAVAVRASIDTEFYVIQITDTHLPTHLYYYESGADSDTSEMEDLHAVIDDINIINPDFVLLTGDVVNEGELEDYLDKRYFTKAQRILERLDVPVYLIAGNHDIGGWDDTPPPDGTARRNWWKFFGWRYLEDPPSGDPLHTQDYSFDHGGAHFVGIEAYNNYDRWRRTVYGRDSFTDDQLDWLADDLSVVPPTTPVLAFYHMDFQDQLSLSSLGIDCALWGHVHYTSGSINSPPYNLSTETVCDGERAMRLVRIDDGIIIPTEPIAAGSSGQMLRLEFDTANDGTSTEITANVVNNQPETFEHGLIKFRVPADSAPYEVDAGEITQTVIESGVAVCYVEIPMPAYSITTVTISPSGGTGVPGDGGSILALARPVWPNPAGDSVGLSFALAVRAHVRADVVNVAGRLVATLSDEELPRGTYDLRWDLRDAAGADVASGVYFLRIRASEEQRLERFVVLR